MQIWDIGVRRYMVHQGLISDVILSTHRGLLVLLSTISIVIITGGCARYRPMPLDHDAVEKNLVPPLMSELAVKAEKIKHPVLRPVKIDYKDGLSPDEAAVVAVLVNPELKAIRDRKGIASSQVLLAGILPNPELSYTLEAPVGSYVDHRSNAYDLGISWDLKALITRDASLRAAKAHEASVALDVAWKEWQVAEAAKLSVYRLIIAERKLKTAKKALDNAGKIRALMEDGLRLGEKNTLAVANSYASFEEARQRFIEAKQEKERDALMLDRILGFPPGRLVKLQDNIILSGWNDIPGRAFLVAGLDDRRLDLVALKKGYECEDQRLRQAVLSAFPDIGLKLLRSRDTDRVKTQGLGVNIELPFFDRAQGRVALEKATRRALFDEYSARLFEARSDIALILSRMRSVRDQYYGLKPAIFSMEKTVKGYQRALNRSGCARLGYYTALSRLYTLRLKSMTLEKDLYELGIALEIASGEYIPHTLECSQGHMLDRGDKR